MVCRSNLNIYYHRLNLCLVCVSDMLFVYISICLYRHVRLRRRRAVRATRAATQQPRHAGGVVRVPVQLPRVHRGAVVRRGRRADRAVVRAAGAGGAVLRRGDGEHPRAAGGGVFGAGQDARHSARWGQGGRVWALREIFCGRRCMQHGRGGGGGGRGVGGSGD